MGFECVPAIAAGTFVRAISGQGSCDAPWQTPTTYASPTQPGCNACICGTPQPGSCSGGSISAWTSNNCSTGSVGTIYNAGCITMSAATHRSMLIEPATASASNCPHSGGGPKAVAETTVCWLAADPATSCGPGMVCVPEGSGRLCNLLPGGSNCPAGYQPPEPLAEVVADNRTCDCGCGLSTGQFCDGGGSLYSSPGCNSGFVATIPDDNQCTDTPDLASGSIMFTKGSWTAGSCAPITTAGSIEFGATEQVCCLP